MADPYVVAWTDQFGALLRDKCVEMLQVVELTDWDSVAHTFNDPYDADKWRLMYDDGEFTLQNITEPDAGIVVLNLDRLGITP